MRRHLFLKSQTELLADIKARMADSGNALATDAQYYAAINEAIRMWGTRVLVPKLYSFDFEAGIYEYVLPSLVRTPFTLQIRDTFFGPFGIQLDADSVYTYESVAGYSIEPAASGGFILRLASTPYAETGHIIWYAETGPVPTTQPTVTTTISSTDTSLVMTVTGAPDVNNSGYLKVDNEWMFFSGITRTSSTSYTAANLIRGRYDTIAATHTSGTTVAWGVGADDLRLWTQLLDYTCAYIHALQLHKSTTEDVSRHEKLMSYYQQKADTFWRTHGYVSQYRPRMKLGRNALGPMGW